MTRSEVSCKDCKERYVGCHSECPRYRKWKEEWEKEKEWNRRKLAPIFEAYGRWRTAIENAIRRRK